MKLIYLTENTAKEITGQKISNIQYLRRYAGLFNKEIYILDDFFTKDGDYYTKPYLKDYVVLGKQEMKFLDNIIEKYGSMSSKKLKEAIYDTKPMEGCTIGGNQKMGEIILFL